MMFLFVRCVRSILLNKKKILSKNSRACVCVCACLVCIYLYSFWFCYIVLFHYVVITTTLNILRVFSCSFFFPFYFADFDVNKIKIKEETITLIGYVDCAPYTYSQSVIRYYWSSCWAVNSSSPIECFINPESPITTCLPQVATGTVYKNGQHRWTLHTTSIRRSSQTVRKISPHILHKEVQFRLAFDTNRWRNLIYVLLLYVY